MRTSGRARTVLPDEPVGSVELGRVQPGAGFVLSAPKGVEVRNDGQGRSRRHQAVVDLARGARSRARQAFEDDARRRSGRFRLGRARILSGTRWHDDGSSPESDHWGPVVPASPCTSSSNHNPCSHNHNPRSRGVDHGTGAEERDPDDCGQAGDRGGGRQVIPFPPQEGGRQDLTGGIEKTTSHEVRSPVPTPIRQATTRGGLGTGWAAYAPLRRTGAPHP